MMSHVCATEGPAYPSHSEWASMEKRACRVRSRLLESRGLSEHWRFQHSASDAREEEILHLCLRNRRNGKEEPHLPPKRKVPRLRDCAPRRGKHRDVCARRSGFPRSTGATEKGSQETCQSYSRATRRRCCYPTVRQR